MDTSNGFKPPLPPATSAEAATIAIKDHAVDLETPQKNAVAEPTEVEEDGGRPSGKPVDAGFKNYFVSTSRDYYCPKLTKVISVSSHMGPSLTFS